MDSLVVWVTVLVAAAISAVAIAYVVRPLLAPGPAPIVLEDDRLTDLLSRKDSALAAIKELEFDYQVGKMSEEDFQRMDQRLRRQAIGLIQQIEKLAPESATLDERLEAEIARLRRTQERAAVQPAPLQPSPAQPEVTSTPAAATVPPVNGDAPRAARFCTNCGHPLEPAHKFCAYCGAPVANPALAPSDGASL
jgi:hypothetical protein